MPRSRRPFEVPVPVIPPVDRKTAAITDEFGELSHRRVWRKGVER
jgi:hypothetical protein